MQEMEIWAVDRPDARDRSGVLIADSDFQSLRLALVTVSTIPAVVAGVVVMLYLPVPQSTFNLLSARSWPLEWPWQTRFCLLRSQRSDVQKTKDIRSAAVTGAGSRLRAI